METFRSSICGVENCRSKRYHIGEDGFTYCHNGHKKDAGLVIGEDDFTGQPSQGASQTSRARVEQPDREHAPFLLGREAIIMYLQCFQFVLWKQAHWLVNTKGYPQELETVIHDLWVLRLQMLQALIEDPDENRATKLFSTSDTDDSDLEKASSSVTQAALRQKAPRLIQTVSICYLSLVLLRIPVCSNDVYEWIISRDFAYLHAFRELPHDMKNRLALTLRGHFYARTGVGELENLHGTVINLAWAYRGAFGLIIPPINHHLLLYRFVSHLAIPLDTFPAAEHLSRLLGHDFAFPRRPSKFTYLRLHKYPEIKLMCTLIIVTKLFFSFDSDRVYRHPTSAASPAALVIDWEAWNNARAEYKAESVIGDTTEPFDRSSSHDHANAESTSQAAAAARTRANRAKRKHAELLETTEDDVFSMSGADMDAYLAWFDRTWIEGGGASNEAAANLAESAGDDERDAFLAATAASRSGKRGQQEEFRRALFRMFPSGPSRARRRASSEDATALSTTPPASDGGKADVDPFDGYGEQEGTVVLDEATRARIDRIRAVQGSLLPRSPIAVSESKSSLPSRSRSHSRSGSASNSDTVMGMNGGDREAMAWDNIGDRTEGVLRPGSRYKHYRNLEEVPEIARGFFEDAARLVGLRDEEMVRAVFQVEMKLQDWVRYQGRGKHRRDGDGDAEMDDADRTPPKK